MKNRFIYLMAAMLAVIAVVLAGCAGSATPNQSANSSNPTSTANTNPGGTLASSGQPISTGRLEIAVMDAPAKDTIKSIMVELNSVEIHTASTGSIPAVQDQGTEETEDQSGVSGNWTSIDLSQTAPFDLLQVAGSPLTLASISSVTGNFTQIRLVVESVKVTFVGADNKEYTEDATVPSGKIKFVHPFNITTTDIKQLLFDFDAAQSINVTGNGKVLFKPVIKLTVNEKSGDKGPENKGPEATNSNSNKGTANASANAETLQITNTNLPSGTINMAYPSNVKLEAVGGKEPYKWSISSGALPAGLSLNSANGMISGTPTASGDFSVTIKVTDNSKPEAKTSTKVFTIHISPAA